MKLVTISEKEKPKNTLCLSTIVSLNNNNNKKRKQNKKIKNKKNYKKTNKK